MRELAQRCNLCGVTNIQSNLQVSIIGVGGSSLLSSDCHATQQAWNVFLQVKLHAKKTICLTNCGQGNALLRFDGYLTA